MLKLKTTNKLIERAKMMRGVYSNKIMCVALLSLFAFASNLTEGNPLLAGRSLFPSPLANPVAHGPMLPPDPWAGTVTKPVTVAHGPMLPPDPWAGTVTKPVTVAHGPMLPPDPWAGTVTKPMSA